MQVGESQYVLLVTSQLQVVAGHMSRYQPMSLIFDVRFQNPNTVRLANSPSSNDPYVKCIDQYLLLCFLQSTF
jgi:hypothetical protein